MTDEDEMAVFEIELDDEVDKMNLPWKTHVVVVLCSPPRHFPSHSELPGSGSVPASDFGQALGRAPAQRNPLPPVATLRRRPMDSE